MSDESPQAARNNRAARTLTRPRYHADDKLGPHRYPCYTRCMLRISLVLALVIAVTGRATADEERLPLVVEVGQTVSREVGFAMGHMCDDETILKAEMKNGTVENNLFVVTGVKPGTTLCRAGTVQDRPTILFEIRVVPRRSAPPKPPVRR